MILKVYSFLIFDFSMVYSMNRIVVDSLNTDITKVFSMEKAHWLELARLENDIDDIPMLSFKSTAETISRLLEGVKEFF
jgi:hypothetical protein